MGGSSGGSFSNTDLTALRSKIRQTEEQSIDNAFRQELTGMFAELLGGYNKRDVGLITERLDDIKGTLAAEITESLDQIYGGSVAKHTYVDGLSDVDSLLFIDDAALTRKKPQTVLKKLQRILDENLAGDVTIRRGRMALTISYNDGMEIQILPAIATESDHFRIPSARSPGKWSKVNPAAFQDVLSKRNQQCAGKLVPTIKLAKAIVGQLPEAQRLSGYHMESLAISAFKDYSGSKTTSAMLPYFFSRSRELLLSPIRDKSGQSLHVDGYLGPTDSQARQTASHAFGRIFRRMSNASAANSINQWKALFGEE